MDRHIEYINKNPQLKSCGFPFAEKEDYIGCDPKKESSTIIETHASPGKGDAEFFYLVPLHQAQSLSRCTK
ncbi:hypothetical protein [Aequorivita xiaoshiensis]|uniref:Uncharacterized protein n=1 Tax=Aequorivita xiaoshiensis TaxID=2874476 RepID=A0A9X1U603_9FLAO|nr:hypothetical protein [Aequorivita xiaoshiensis]MCG2431098.1 hypothetical protein [Aequorivita xiaoshiensis]